MTETSPAANAAIEEKKLEHEQAKHQDDISLRKQELDIRREEISYNRWANPLFLSILAAIVAIAGNIWVSKNNADNNIELEKTKQTREIATETLKAEAARILEVIKGSQIEKTKTNLKFLIESGLISNKETIEKLQNYLEKTENADLPFFTAPNLDGNLLRMMNTMSRRERRCISKEISTNEMIEQARVNLYGKFKIKLIDFGSAMSGSSTAGATQINYYIGSTSRENKKQRGVTTINVSTYHSKNKSTISISGRESLESYSLPAGTSNLTGPNAAFSAASSTTEHAIISDTINNLEDRFGDKILCD